MPTAATMPTTVLRGKAIIATVHQYALNKAKADKADAENKLLKDEIIKAMGGATVASCGTHMVRVTETDGTPAKPNLVIGKEHIGLVIAGSKGRAGGTRLEVI